MPTKRLRRITFDCVYFFLFFDGGLQNFTNSIRSRIRALVINVMLTHESGRHLFSRRKEDSSAMTKRKYIFCKFSLHSIWVVKTTSVRCLAAERSKIPEKGKWISCNLSFHSHTLQITAQHFSRLRRIFGKLSINGHLKPQNLPIIFCHPQIDMC